MNDVSYRQLLTIKEVMARTGMSRSCLYREISRGCFVAPAKLGSANRWDSAAVDRWIQSKLLTRGGRIDGKIVQ